MADTVSEALNQFITKLITIQPEPPLIPYNSEWLSECYLAEATDGEQVPWRPAPQSNTDMFTRLEEALEEKIHPDIISYYSAYWSDPLPATCSDGDLTLLLVWNEEDMERLRSNLIGHALSKRQQKRPLTFFIACPEPDENFFISVDNFTGEVLLETPGKPPIRKLADNLTTFLDSLTPKPVPDME